GRDREQPVARGAAGDLEDDGGRREVDEVGRRRAAVDQRLLGVAIEVDVVRGGDPAVAAAEREADHPVIEERHLQRAGRGAGDRARDDHAAVAREVLAAADERDRHGLAPWSDPASAPFLRRASSGLRLGSVADGRGSVLSTLLALPDTLSI